MDHTGAYAFNYTGNASRYKVNHCISLSVPNSSDGIIFVKRRRQALFKQKYRQKNGLNLSFACLLLRSATPLRVQSVIIELPKQLTNALNIH